MFQTKVAEKIKICIFIVPFTRQCGKIWQSRTGHRRQYNTAHALCVHDKATETHSEHVDPNTSGFLTAKMVTQKRHNVTLYAYCLYYVSLPATFRFLSSVFVKRNNITLTSVHAETLFCLPLFSAQSNSLAFLLS
jgi:hypothetical protein